MFSGKVPELSDREFNHLASDPRILVKRITELIKPAMDALKSRYSCMQEDMREYPVQDYLYKMITSNIIHSDFMVGKELHIADGYKMDMFFVCKHTGIVVEIKRSKNNKPTDHEIWKTFQQGYDYRTRIRGNWPAYHETNLWLVSCIAHWDKHGELTLTVHAGEFPEDDDLKPTDMENASHKQTLSEMFVGTYSTSSIDSKTDFKPEDPYKTIRTFQPSATRVRQLPASPSSGITANREERTALNTLQDMPLKTLATQPVVTLALALQALGGDPVAKTGKNVGSYKAKSTLAREISARRKIQ